MRETAGGTGAVLEQEGVGADGAAGRLARLCPSPILRIDLVRDLGPVAEAGMRTSWFRLLGQEVVELPPDQDSDLPLAGELGALGPLAVLSYRPRRRLVLRRDSPRGEVVEKGYRARRSSLAALRHRIAVEALSGSPVRAPRLYLRRPETESCVLQAFEGSPPALGLGAVDVFRSLGAGVRALQRFTIGACLPVFGPDEELEVLDERASRLERLGIEVPRDWLDCRALLGLRFDGLGTVRPVLTHRDLHDGQILVAGSRVALLDFDLLCLADPALDPGNLLAHLELRVLQRRSAGSADALPALSSAFLEGLRPQESDFGGRLRIYRASSLLRLALVYAARPPWQSLVPALIRRAERWLGR